MYLITWTNKYSNESGYVSKVCKTKGHFINSFEKDKAKRYKTEKLAAKDISILNEIGEGNNNTFTILAENQ